MNDKSIFKRIIIVGLIAIFIVAVPTGIFYWLSDGRTPQEQCEEAVLYDFYQSYAEASDYLVEILGVETTQLDVKPVVDFYTDMGENVLDGGAFKVFKITIYYYGGAGVFGNKITYIATISHSGHYVDVDVLEVL